MKKLSLRFISLCLAACMLLALAPAQSAAAEAAQHDIPLMSLCRTQANAVPDSGRQFDADDGVFAGVSTLTAWNNNEQIVIGYQGSNRTPIVINNAAVNNNPAGGNGWRSVGPAAIDAGITVDTATAFQIKFETTGYENIRFSAAQKSTGSGPLSFALAYSVGSETGPFTAIPDSGRDVTRVSNDTYAALTPSYAAFELPAALEDQGEVYLRLYLADCALTDRANGNTSINDIEILGDVRDAGERPVDFTALQDAIAQARGTPRCHFANDAAWKAMQCALAAATAVRGNPLATQENADTAARNLKLASLTHGWAFPSIHLTAENHPFEMEREIWHSATASVTGFSAQGDFLDADVMLRGRGHSTWYNEGIEVKRPLRLRFSGEPRSMMGSEYAARDWILLANVMDKTLQRNDCAFDFTRRMNTTMQYVPMGQHVHLYVNGAYVGVYLLTDERDVNPGRMDLTYDPDPAKSDYFIEYDVRATEDGNVENDNYVLVDGRPYDIRFPSSGSQRRAQSGYLKGYLTSVSAAIQSRDFDAVTALIDLDTFVDYYIVSEFFHNLSLHYSSLFMYICGQGDRRRLFVGPIWDFDQRYSGRPRELIMNNDVSWTEFPPNYWYANLLEIPEFKDAVKTRWNQLMADKVPQGIAAYMRCTAWRYRADFGRNFGRQTIFNSFLWDVASEANWFDTRVSFLNGHFNDNAIFSTLYEGSIKNWLLFILGFGWIWMWF